MSGTSKGLTRQQMADRIALRVPGWLDRQPGRRHSDHVLEHRYRRSRHHLPFGEWRDRLRADAPAGQEDLNLVNAGGQNVTLKPGAAVVHHAEVFAIIRGGRIDVTVMGAYEVAVQRRFRQLEDRPDRRAAALAVPWTSRPAPNASSSSWSRPRAVARRGSFRNARCR